MKNKRGLSEVVTTLVLVLLVIVAISVIWIVVVNLLSSKSEEISSTSFQVSMSVKSVEADPLDPNKVILKIERDTGEGNIKGIDIVLFDGEKSYTHRENTPIKVGEEIKKSISKGGLGAIKKVSVRPVFELNSGKEKIGEVIGTKDLTLDQSIKSVGGLVSWYRFEDNAEDIIGINEGTCNSATNTCPTYIDSGSNARKKSASFDGVNDYVNVGIWSLVFCTIAVGFSASYWSKWKDSAVVYEIPFGLFGSTPFYTYISSAYAANAPTYVYISPITKNIWYHTLITYDGTTRKIYLDGVLKTSTSGISITKKDNSLFIGTYGTGTTPSGNYFYGEIDEVMIFNKALTAAEVKTIYESTKS